jgi:hypothetical protein
MSTIKIRKPNFLDRLAHASEHADNYNLNKILERLEDEPLMEIADSLSLLPDEGEKAHLKKDWYGGEQDSWWPEYEVEKIIRDGYVRLLTAVKQHKLPVEAFWIDDTNEFKVDIHVGKRQITMFLITPPHPEPEDWDRDK